MDSNASKLPPQVGATDTVGIASPARRRLLGHMAVTPWLLLATAATLRATAADKAGAAAAKSKCVDMDALPASQTSIRRSLNFKLESTDAQKHCSLCAFFTATDGGCGTCQILTGGAVSPNSVCDSFAAKS